MLPLWIRPRISKKTVIGTVIFILVFIAVCFGAWMAESKIAALRFEVANLTKENYAFKSEDTQTQLAQYNDAVGEYEMLKDTAATYQAQGVDTAAVQAQLPQAIDLILGKKYPEAHALMSTLDAQLAAALKAKQTSVVVAKVAPTPVKSATNTTTGSCGVPAVGGYCHLLVHTSSGNFYAYIVAVSALSIVTDTANDTDCTNNCPAKPLASYVSQDGGSAGIHGTYFCPPDYSSCAGQVNSYFYPVWNSRLGKWLEQGKLGLSNRAMMAFTGSGPTFCAAASSCAGIGGLHAAIVNEPGLVGGGKNIVGNYSLTSDQLVKSTRGGIGAKGDTVYFVIAQSATVPNLAAVMVAIGCDSALNLDGGGSAALMYHGKYVVGPGRQLPNAIVSK